MSKQYSSKSNSPSPVTSTVLMSILNVSASRLMPSLANPICSSSRDTTPSPFASKTLNCDQ